MRFALACLTLAIPVLLLVGCADVGESLAEREIVRRAPEIIGPADRYTADVRGLSETHARQVQLHGVRVRPIENLVIQSLQLTLRDVTFQVDPFHISRVGSSDFTMQISDRDLTSYLLQLPRVQRAGINNVNLIFGTNTVQLAASVPFVGQNLQVSTSGQLTQVGGTQIQYRPQALTVGGVTLPADFLTQLSGRVNPVLDLTALRFTPQARQVTLAPGVATISGSATVTNLP